MLDRAENIAGDLMGCFVVGFNDDNVSAAARLLMEDAPDSPSGRVRGGRVRLRGSNIQRRRPMGLERLCQGGRLRRLAVIAAARFQIHR
jgi:hypothetical protein